MRDPLFQPSPSRLVPRPAVLASPGSPEVARRLSDILDRYRGWIDLDAVLRCGAAVHLAVISEPSATRLLAGEFHRLAYGQLKPDPPFKQIESGDLVLVKLPRGPIVGSFTAGQSEHFTPGGDAEDQERRLSDLVLGDAGFSSDGFRTFVAVTRTKRLWPVQIARVDFGRWVVLRQPDCASGSEQISLI